MSPGGTAHYKDGCCMCSRYLKLFSYIVNHSVAYRSAMVTSTCIVWARTAGNKSARPTLGLQQSQVAQKEQACWQWYRSQLKLGKGFSQCTPRLKYVASCYSHVHKKQGVGIQTLSLFGNIATMIERQGPPTTCALFDSWHFSLPAGTLNLRLH